VTGEQHAVDPDVVWRAQLTRINTPPPEGAAFSAFDFDSQGVDPFSW